MKISSLFAGLAVSLGSLSGNAATIAIIDSGVDYQHAELSDQMWINPLDIPSDRIDNDSNGFVDDVYGWNFAEQDNMIIDYQYADTYTPDVVKFFEIQQKALTGQVTAEEAAWINEIFEDAEFVSNLMIFGNYAHGTHVAGVSASVSDSNQIIAIKLMPTKNPLQTISKEVMKRLEEGTQLNIILDWIFRAGLDLLAKQQSSIFGQVGSYVNGVGANVANGSFGVSTAAVKPIIAQILRLVMPNKEPSESLINKYASHLVRRINFHSRAMMVAAPETLFVFAAGNDGTDNGVQPISPANAREFNSITVGATYRNGKIAPFSNYSRTLVDIAAPGVAIESTIPGDNRLVMSGTSQAAPFVAGVAAAIINENPELNILDIKKILMETVDKVPSLVNKVKAGGVVNSSRAVFAAKLSKSSNSVSEAIAASKVQVKDEIIRDLMPIENARNFVLPLKSLIWQ